ncbi:hypothetical protein LBR02_05390 [Levilactobacillus brevis]|nr:hypothetical protein LBR02_05390 [Levilactobacillus brevis]
MRHLFKSVTEFTEQKAVKNRTNTTNFADNRNQSLKLDLSLDIMKSRQQLFIYTNNDWGG